MKKAMLSARVFLEQKDELAKQVGVLFQISWATAEITTAQKKSHFTSFFQKRVLLSPKCLHCRGSTRVLFQDYGCDHLKILVEALEGHRCTKCKTEWTVKKVVNTTSVIWFGRRFYSCSGWLFSEKYNIYGISEAFSCVPNRGLIVLFDQIGIVGKSFRWLKRHSEASCSNSVRQLNFFKTKNSREWISSRIYLLANPVYHIFRNITSCS